MPLAVMLCHHPDDEKADKTGTPGKCRLCDVDLVITAKGMQQVEYMILVCYTCAKKGPEHVLKAIAQQEENDDKED